MNNEAIAVTCSLHGPQIVPQRQPQLLPSVGKWAYASVTTKINY